MARHRVRLPKRTVEIWKPRWEPEIKGWTHNFIRKNKWRYEYTNEFEDLMQDAYLVFLKVADSYPRVVEPAHFMSLYKTSLRNALWDKAREYSRKLDLIDEKFVLESDADALDRRFGGELNEGTLGVLIADGPPELRLLLNALHDENYLAELQKPQRAKRGEPRLNLDQRLSKLLGIDCFPFRQALTQLLAH